jgi:hypothetical protein
MTITTYTVNATGLAEIEAILKASSNHEFIDGKCLAAYAADVEESLDAGNPAMFEIRGMHTKSGNPETFTIDGFDTKETEEE